MRSEGSEGGGRILFPVYVWARRFEYKRKNSACIYLCMILVDIRNFFEPWDGFLSNFTIQKLALDI